jgi:hypothetical protein
MADYKVIHRAEGAEIPWEPGCPVALTAVQVSRNTETSEAWLQAKARNVSDAEAGSVYADLSLEYADGTGETIPAEFLDADVPAGAEQPLKPRKLPRGDVQSCSLTVKRVEGPGGTWESTGEASPLPSPEKLSLSPRAFSQRARAVGTNAGDSVLHGKVQDHDGWWVCACGQVNVRRSSCCSCGNPKERLMANEDEAALLADADEHEKEVFAEAAELKERGTIESLGEAADKLRSIGDHEGAAELLAQCEGKLSELKGARKKRRTRIAAIVSAVAAVSIIAAVVVTQVIIPAQEKAAEEARIAQKMAPIKEAISSAQVGGTVELGSYEQDNVESDGKEPISWRVLVIENGKALLISEKALDYKPFNASSTQGNDFETSYLKAWLADQFMDDAFGDEVERGLIIDTPFCLTVEEAMTYFSSDYDRKCEPTSYALSQVPSGHLRMDHGGVTWWLSTPSESQTSKTTWLVGTTGDVLDAGMNRTYSGEYVNVIIPVNDLGTAVRPAIWVQL